MSRGQRWNVATSRQFHEKWIAYEILIFLVIKASISHLTIENKLFVWFLVVIDTNKDDFTDGSNDGNDAMLQVSTSTGSLSHYYNLAIIVPRAYILGADEYYAMAGGDISLVCIIEDVSGKHEQI